MNRNAWRKLLVAMGILGVVLAAPVPAPAQSQEAAAADEEASLTNVLASLSSLAGSFFYAPFKAVVMCPVSAVGAGATWAVTGGATYPAKQVLHVGCEGDYFVTRPMVRGQAEFREPDAPDAQLGSVARPSVAQTN